MEDIKQIIANLAVDDSPLSKNTQEELEDENKFRFDLDSEEKVLKILRFMAGVALLAGIIVGVIILFSYQVNSTKSEVSLIGIALGLISALSGIILFAVLSALYSIAFSLRQLRRRASIRLLS